MEPYLLNPIFSHFGVFFCPSFDTIEAEVEVVWCSEGTETSCCGGAGRSIAWEKTEETSGAGILDPRTALMHVLLLKKSIPLSASSSNLKSKMDDGASCSSARLRSLTLGSETFKSRFGGV